MIRLGYPCQNLTLSASTNHTCRLKSLADPGYVRGLIERNLDDLERILAWNAREGWDLFRIGQAVVPFASHPDFPFDWRDVARERLERMGALAGRLGQRLSMHPGQYVNPGSPDPDVRERSLAELHYAADVLDLMGVDEGVIVLHLGGAYKDPTGAVARFVDAVGPHTRILRYLALECDERTWHIRQVTDVARILGVPAIVDTLHHALNPGGLSLDDALDLAIPTWKDRRVKLHLSSQKEGATKGAHADSIRQADWDRLMESVADRDVDVMIEAKHKEMALEGIGVKAGAS